MTYLEKIEKLQPAVINKVIDSRGKLQGLEPELQQYILEFDSAARLYKEVRILSRSAEKLQVEYPNLSFATARNRVCDAINYLHLDSTLSKAAIHNMYADRFDRLAEVALQVPNLKEARLAWRTAHDSRILAADLNENTNQGDVVLILSSDINCSRFGIEKKNLNGLAKKIQDGYFFDLINKLKTTKENKMSMMEDAEIIEEEHEESAD